MVHKIWNTMVVGVIVLWCRNQTKTAICWWFQTNNELWYTLWLALFNCFYHHLYFHCSQWKGEVAQGCPEFTEKEKKHLGQELSDVLIYLIRLSQLCHIDLPQAVLDKFEHNAAKYPSSKVYGSSKKYNEYYNANSTNGSSNDVKNGSGEPISKKLKEDCWYEVITGCGISHLLHTSKEGVVFF